MEIRGGGGGVGLWLPSAAGIMILLSVSSAGVYGFQKNQKAGYVGVRGGKDVDGESVLDPMPFAHLEEGGVSTADVAVGGGAVGDKVEATTWRRQRGGDNKVRPTDDKVEAR